MRGFKKVLVALLVVMTILGTTGPVFAAVPPDVQGTKYEDVALRLMALGIFKGDDKGNFNPDMPITRAEATAIVVRALGLEKSAELMKGVTRFPDVNADPGLQWATGVINIAVAQGIINGYPDGRFGGRDNVTYAQLAKMILYALNYGVTVEGGVWPTAVLAKADDLGILEGLSVVADAPLTRAEAAKMLDNSLDIPSLKQTGYGSLTYYEETGKTLLERMGIEKVEGRVVEIPAVNSALDDDEVVIGDKTYTVLEGVDVVSLFGLEVKAWVNDDDEIVYVEKKTADKDVYTDTLAGKVENNKVKLVVLDDDVTFDENATVYVNYKKAKLSELDKDYYGRLVKDKNKIVFASLFNFEKPNGVVVTAVDGKKIKYFDMDDKERTLDLSDADAVTVYNKDLSKASLDDIEKDTVLYWWEADDEYHIVIVNEKVEGVVSKITSSKVTIDGKAYTFDSGKGTYSLDEDDTIKKYEGDAADISDFDEEEVVALLNLKGRIRHLRGAAKTTSGTQYGIVVDAPKYNQVTIFTKDGEEVTYGIEDRSDYRRFESYKFHGASKSDELYYAAVAYKVTADGEIAKSEENSYVGLANGVGMYYNTLTPAVTLEDDTKGRYFGDLTKNADSSKIGIDGKSFYASSGTVVMRAVDEEGKLDPEVISWEDFEALEIKENGEAIVFVENNREAKFIVFVNPAFEGARGDTYYAVALSDVYRSGGKWKVDLDVFDEGKGTYVVPSEGYIKEGEVFAFKLNSKGEVARGKSSSVVSVTLGTVDKGYFQSNGTWYKIDSGAVIYQLDEEGDIDKAIAAADLEEKTKGEIRYVADEDNVVKALVYAPPVEAPAPAPQPAGASISGDFIFANLNNRLTATLTGSAAEKPENYSLVVYQGAEIKRVLPFTTASLSNLSGKDLNLKEGWLQYTVQVVDEQTGGVLASRTIVTPEGCDFTAPVAAITSPANGATVNGNNVEFVGTASDANIQSWTLVAVKDTASVKIAEGTTSVTTESFGAWDTTQVADGNWTVTLTVTDQAGNTATAQVTVTVDNTPPAAPSGLTATAGDNR